MGSIADTLSRQLGKFVATHAPTRVLVGGLPGFVIEAIGRSWAGDVELFVVAETPANGAPLASRAKRCGPDDLTAARQDSWAALVHHSKSREIQESIRSAGAGTVREVWQAGFPWQPCNLPGVRFSDVTKEWVRELKLEEHEAAIRDCVKNFRNELRGEVDACDKFFTALDAVPTAAASYDEICFSLGFPKHAPGARLRDPGNSAAVLACLHEFVGRFRQDGSDAAEELKDAAAGIKDTVAQAAVKSAIDAFATGFRSLEPIDSENPVRAWRAALAKRRPSWELLNHQMLQLLLGVESRLFEIRRCEIANGTATQVFEVGDTRVIARNENVTTPSITTRLLLNEELGKQAGNRLFAKAAGNPQQTQVGNVPQGTGPHPFDVKFRSGGRHAIRLTIGPTTAVEHAAVSLPVLWECSHDYPFIAANSRAKVRPGRRRKGKREDDRKDFLIDQNLTVPFQGRAALQCFIYGLNGQLSYDAGEGVREAKGLQEIPNSKVKQFTLPVDVVDGGEVDFIWVDGDLKTYRARVSFTVKGEQGLKNDSISSALVEAHRRGHSKSLQAAITTIKAGKPVNADELPVRPSLKAVGFWESRQQDGTNGWWPFLVDSNAGVIEQKLEEKGTVFVSSRLLLNEQANGWRSALAAPVPPMPPAVAGYVAARKRLLEAIAGQFLPNGSGSAADVRLARHGLIGFVADDIVEAHVRAFVDMMAAVRANALPPEWSWRACCVDTVVCFPGSGTEPSATLLGPFHPINVARNHGIQRCLGERIGAGRSSEFALLLAQVQPLFTGQVLDSQLRLVDAISFPTGGTEWVFLYRQGASKLPGPELVEWLQRIGLDPSIGPMGVDPEILPDTMRQYAMAYPARKNITLLLDDFSQASFQVIREDLAAAAEGKKSIRDVLPGLVRIFADKGKLERVDGELIAYDPDLPLMWHHSLPPDPALVDLATLPKSNHVDFAPDKGFGAISSVVPTIRRPLVQHSMTGLRVAGGIGAGHGQTGLPGAIAALIREMEPEGKVLSWGSSLLPKEPLKARWTLCSAGQVDARLFIDYVSNHPNTALWTYRLFGVGADGHTEYGRGHFLLASVSQALAKGLEARLALTKLPITPSQLMKSLAKAGLTLGDEFLRTGRAAEGALGQFLIERLVWGDDPAKAALPHWTTDAGGNVLSAGFLIQVDPIKAILEALHPASEGDAPAEDESNQRSDLIAFDVKFCDGRLWVHPTVIESKFFASGTTSGVAAQAQAAVTAGKLSAILEQCIVDPTKAEGAAWAQPERILMADIIHLGLRLARGSFSGTDRTWAAFESRVVTAVLSGNFNRTETGAIAIVHHAKQTADNLSAAERHAYVAIDDAASSLAAKPPEKYTKLQEHLGAILRHDCHATPPRPAPLSPQTPAATEPAVPLAAQPAHMPPVPPPLRSSDAIKKAHDTFDAAFKDFIGNKAAIEKLRDDLVDALTKRPPYLPSAYLLTGNPSTGKTTLANKVAKLLGVTFVKLVGTNIRSDKDLIEQVDNAFKHARIPPALSPSGTQGIPEHVYAACLIFIDEIHLVRPAAQEALLTLTEPKDRYVRLRDRICLFPKATYMAATTRESEIDKALRTRFGNPIHLNDYKPEEVAVMLATKSPVWAAWPEEVRHLLATLSRCIPREAERLAAKLERKMAVAREHLEIKQAIEKLRVEEGLDRNGLDRVYWKALLALAKQDRPLGRDALAQQLGITDSERLVEEIVPKLRSMGLVAQHANGQQITDRGRLYIRNEAPPSAD